jgi:hypothetical protein
MQTAHAMAQKWLCHKDACDAEWLFHNSPPKFQRVQTTQAADLVLRRQLLSYSDCEVSVGDVAVGHSWSVEGEAGVSLVIEKDYAAGGMGAFG